LTSTWLSAKENTVMGKAIAASGAKKSLFLLENRLFQSLETYSEAPAHPVKTGQARRGLRGTFRPASEEPRRQIATDLDDRAHPSPSSRKSYIRLAEVADALGKDIFEKGLLVRCRVPHAIIAICNGLID
jgi:hypothetical protein